MESTFATVIDPVRSDRSGSHSWPVSIAARRPIEFNASTAEVSISYSSTTCASSMLRSFRQTIPVFIIAA
jgi:hypothetical protein